MPQNNPSSNPPIDEAKPSLSHCPILLNDGIKALLIDEDGSIENLDAFDALMRLKSKPHLVVHSVFTIDRLARFASKNGNAMFGAAINVAHFDVLELFAFIHPTVFVRPSIGGLLDAMGIENPESLEEQAIRLHEMVGIMLNSCSPQQINKAGISDPRQARQLAQAMHLAGWVWGAPILKQMGAEVYDRPELAHDSTGVNIWARLPNWEEFAPRPPAGSLEVSAKEAQDLLTRFTGKDAEIREGQQKYAAEASKAFTARDSDQHPHIVLGEAGTGIGKTFGYLAPALAWARKNDGKVQISTYTKALQRQIDQQLDFIYPNKQSKQASTVIRKGRENYMCLLNFEEWAGKAIHQKGAQAVVAGKPLFEFSTHMLARFYQATDGKIPLIGTGGIYDGASAYAKICAGATLVQLYSCLIYTGTGIIDDLRQGILDGLKRDGFDTIEQAVGSQADFWANKEI